MCGWNTRREQEGNSISECTNVPMTTDGKGACGEGTRNKVGYSPGTIYIRTCCRGPCRNLNLTAVRSVSHQK